MNSERKIRRSRTSRAIWLQYILALLAWAFAVLLLLCLGYVILRQRIWYETDPLYRLLHWIREYILLVYGFATVAGWLVISYCFISRPQRYLDELLQAAEGLARPDEEPISLPEALRDAENQMNLLRERALRDARAAQAAEQRKNDLVVYLAHDLKTPLTSVIGYLTLLRDEPQISPELRSRYTGIALEKAERLEELVNEFFEITRFNLSHLELQKQPTDLTRMLEQLASEFQPMLRERNMRCRLELPPKLICPCDPDRLARVFDNLLRNACHYGFPDTTVRIAGREEDGHALLTFLNAGPTIPPEKLDRIFDQFFRLDSSRGTGSGGAGLGLAIAKEIVELHGGAILAQSAGSQIVFTVRLPL